MEVSTTSLTAADVKRNLFSESETVHSGAFEVCVVVVSLSLISFSNQ